jgi:hypothetical protein
MDRLAGDRQKRRFVHDGEVPVVVLGGSNMGSSSSGVTATNRLAVAETALDAERVARKQVERTLSEAQALVHDLQTKIGHAGLARDEAVEAVRQLKAETQRLEELLEAERRARAEAEHALRTTLDRRSAPATQGVRPEPSQPSARKRGRSLALQDRPRKPHVKEPKPVKWW